jgi:tetratricopeptide (TPR) repeat protein
VPLLETAAGEDPANLKASLYLAMAYLQLNRIDEAIAVYLKILPRGGAETSQIAFNLGNAYYTKGNTAQAVQYYTEAIEANPSNASAYLNRANTKVSNGTPREAVHDYEFYLTLEPRSAKRPQVEALISFINEEYAAAEQWRVFEAARTQAAAERQAAEAAAAAERRRRLLEEVSASLQAAAEGTQGMSAGSEQVLGYDGEFELE